MTWNKIKWVVGILLVFFLVLATNLIDQRNYRNLKNSIVSIYDDRLLAKGFVFEASLLTHEKDMANALGDKEFYETRNHQVNIKLDELMTEFCETRLTKKEQETIGDLKADLAYLRSMEENAFTADSAFNPTIMESQLKEIKQGLVDLSRIQMEEGKQEMIESKKSMESVELFTQMEIYALIFIAVIAQVIVIYTPKRSSS